MPKFHFQSHKRWPKDRLILFIVITTPLCRWVTGLELQDDIKPPTTELLCFCLSMLLKVSTLKPLFILPKKCCPFLTHFRTTVLNYPLLILGKSKSVVIGIYRGRLTCGSRHVFEYFVAPPRACNLFTRTHTAAAHSPHTAAAQYADHEFRESRKCGTSPAGV